MMTFLDCFETITIVETLIDGLFMLSFEGCCTTDPCGLSWCPDFEELQKKPIAAALESQATPRSSSFITPLTSTYLSLEFPTITSGAANLTPVSPL